MIIYLVIAFKWAFMHNKQESDTLLHIRTLPSFEDEATSVQSSSKCIGYQAILVIHFVCPLSGYPFNWLVSISQIHTYPSWLPLAMYLESGLQAKHNTQLLWPFNVAIGVSVSISHKRMVVSPLPVANTSPWALNWTHKTGYSWPSNAAVYLVIGYILKIDCGWYVSENVFSSLYSAS